MVWTVENDQKRIKMRTMTENIADACVSSIHIGFKLRHNVQFYLYRTFTTVSMDSRKCIKTVVWTRIDQIHAFLITAKAHTSVFLPCFVPLGSWNSWGTFRIYWRRCRSV